MKNKKEKYKNYNKLNKYIYHPIFVASIIDKKSIKFKNSLINSEIDAIEWKGTAGDEKFSSVIR